MKGNVLFITIFNLIVIFSGCSKHEHSELTSVRLQIPKETLLTIEENVDVALDQRVISKNLKTYFDARLIINDSVIPIKIRLKGDWTDHVRTCKRSYRIKMPKGLYFNGMSVFSIQNPETKGFIDEWFLRKVFEMEGILTPRFEFVNVAINGENIGVHAIEEHFQEELLKRSGKSPGPILKIDEEGFWETKIFERENGEEIQEYYPFYEASVIRPFNEKKILKSPKLYKQFLEAQSMLDSIKNGNTPIDKIIKLDELAKLYAICDMARVNHGFAALNQRWYYDSESLLLEPIAHDFNGESRQTDKTPVIYGFRDTNLVTMTEPKYTIPFLPMNSSKFNELYYKYLNMYCNRKYLDKVFDSIDTELSQIEKIIQEEHYFYEFDKSHYYENLPRIHKQLALFKNPTSRIGPLFLFKFPILNQNENNITLFPSISINAYYNHPDSTLFLQNFHNYPVTIDAITNKSKEKIRAQNIKLASYNHPGYDATIKLKSPPRSVVFHVDGEKSNYTVKVIPWPQPNK
jgi:hypothetical protein